MPMPENLTQSRKQNTGNQQELSTLLSATSNMADEQVAPELKPIKTKLEGIIGELKQLQGSGTPTQAQLSPVHEQLRSIDEMYVDEKFEVNGTCPAGQAVCADLLSEAHELVESIQEQIPDEDDE